MAIAADLPLSHEALQRRLAFLRDRSAWHEEKGKRRGDLARLCAATLNRDAAAVALMIGEADTAVELFRDAGETFIRNGVLAGFTLLQLAGDKTSEAIKRFGVQLTNLQRALRREPDDEPVRTRGRIHREVVHGPTDLLAVYQFLASGTRKPGFEESLYSHLAISLRKDGGFSVGSSGLPTREYLTALEFLTSSDAADAVPPDVFKSFEFLFLRRRENLRAAREDTYHWSKMLHPARLLDLQAVALVVTALDCRGTDGVLAEAASAADDPLAALPIKAARRLRRYGL